MSLILADTYKFCPQCGGGLEKRLLKAGEPERLVCRACGFVFYIDPKLAAIAVVPMDGGVVMVRRSINPGYGLWVVPGGFVDVGEIVEDAVVRETLEETHLQVQVARLLNIYSYQDSTTVVAAYITEYLGGELTAGDETLEARVFPWGQIPWDEIPFRSTKAALNDYHRLEESGFTSKRNFCATGPADR
jgi:ADP-ribose pyrophosphatase YjhB (NUDIX family)